MSRLRRSTQLVDDGARLCVCHGTWQLITLASALATHHATIPEADSMRSTVALSGERLSASLRRTMSRFSRQAAAFAEVVWIDDLVAGLTSATDAELRERSGRLRSRLGLAHVTEIWTANPRSPLDRFLLDLYPQADVVVVEDGLATYVAPWSESSQPVQRARSTARMLRMRLGRKPNVQATLLRSGVVPLGQRARKPSLVYLLLAERLGVPRQYRRVSRRIGPDTLRAVLARLHVDTPLAPRTVDRPQALVLGSSYSFWGAMSRDEEARLYTNIVVRLSDAGYDIRWKDHPRTPQPFLAELRDRSGVHVQPYAADHAVPIEVYLRCDPVDLVVGGTSTSLFYVPLIFGDRIRVASFAGSVRPFVQGVRSDIVELVSSRIPDVDAVLVAEREAFELPS